jgi:hypothetical protein
MKRLCHYHKCFACTVLLVCALSCKLVFAQEPSDDASDDVPILQAEAVLLQVQIVGGGPWFTDQISNAAVDNNDRLYASGYLANPTVEHPVLYPLSTIGYYDPGSSWGSLCLYYMEENARIEGVRFLKARPDADDDRVFVADNVSREVVELAWGGDATLTTSGHT